MLSVEEKDLSSKRPLDPVFGRRMWSHNKQTENEDEGSANNSLSLFHIIFASPIQQIWDFYLHFLL